MLRRITVTAQYRKSSPPPVIVSIPFLRRKTERAVGKPFTPFHVLAMLYQVPGLDSSQTLTDQADYPRAILDEREPIRDLL